MNIKYAFLLTLLAASISVASAEDLQNPTLLPDGSAVLSDSVFTAPSAMGGGDRVFTGNVTVMRGAEISHAPWAVFDASTQALQLGSQTFSSLAEIKPLSCTRGVLYWNVQAQGVHLRSNPFRIPDRPGFQAWCISDRIGQTDLKDFNSVAVDLIRG
jgi:hypothetical protein